MSNVVKFWPRDAAKDPDTVLDLHKGEMTDVLLIGYDKSGGFVSDFTAGLSSGPELLWLLDMARERLIRRAMELEGEE